MNNSPSADNLLLGAGVIYLDRYDQNGQLTGDRHLGDCSSFSVTVETIRKDKPDLRTSIYDLPKSVIVGFKPTCQITLNEISRENLALALAGTVNAAHVQEAKTGLVSTITAKKGCAFRLTDSAGYKLFGLKIDNVTAGAALYTAGTDYIVTQGAGIIFIPDTSTIVDDTIITVAYSVFQQIIPQISMAHSTCMAGKITYVGDPTAGTAYMCIIDKVELTVTGGVSFIGDEFTSLQLQGAITSCAKNVIGGGIESFCSVVEIMSEEQIAKLDN